MQAVSNTSPINYLIQIDQVELIRKLYGQLAIPNSVLRELQHPKSPTAVKNWATQVPDWVEIRTPARELDTRVAQLGAGEVSAILLAEEIGADVLIVDERGGFFEAHKRGLRVTGTLGVLDKASALGLVKFAEAVTLLVSTTNFRIRPEVVEMLLNSRGLR